MRVIDIWELDVLRKLRRTHTTVGCQNNGTFLALLNLIPETSLTSAVVIYDRLAVCPCVELTAHDGQGMIHRPMCQQLSLANICCWLQYQSSKTSSGGERVITRCHQVKWSIKVSRCSKRNWRSSQGLSRFCRFVKKSKDKHCSAILLGFRSIVLLVLRESHSSISIVLSGLWIIDRLWHAHIPTSRQASIKNSSPYPPQASWVLHSRLPVQFPGNALVENSRVWCPGPKTSDLIKATSAASPRGSMYL